MIYNYNQIACVLSCQANLAATGICLWCLKCQKNEHKFAKLISSKVNYINKNSNRWDDTYIRISYGILKHINPVARLESFRALKLTRLENFRALKH